jgi:DNA-binding NarL/FixJ family response regulator
MEDMAKNTGPLSGPLIFILEDDPATAAACRENLIARIKADVRAFETIEKMTADAQLDRVDLFIIDIKLSEELSGFEVPALLPARCRFAAFLFMSGYRIDPNQYDKAAGLPFFDFLPKPFSGVYLVHRVKLLLAARLKIPDGLDDRIIKLWARTPYVAVVMDAAFKIRLANHQLAALLEVKSPRDLIGRPWLDFLPEDITETFCNIHGSILNGDLSHFGEYSGAIKAQSGAVHPVRWFNSPFAGSEENEILILSVGLPHKFKLYLADDLRRAWKESILLHRAAIRAIKQMPLKMAESSTCQFNSGGAKI